MDGPLRLADYDFDFDTAPEGWFIVAHVPRDRAAPREPEEYFPPEREAAARARLLAGDRMLFVVRAASIDAIAGSP